MKHSPQLSILVDHARSHSVDSINLKFAQFAIFNLQFLVFTPPSSLLLDAHDTRLYTFS